MLNGKTNCNLNPSSHGSKFNVNTNSVKTLIQCVVSHNTHVSHGDNAGQSYVHI